MKHRRTPRFVAAYQALPPEIQEQAKRAFRLFQDNMSHPGLSIERLEGYPVVWSGRIKRKYRWTFHFEDAPETGERICDHRFIGGHEDVYRKP